MKKKNIIIFTNTLLSGGAEKQALLLAINLKADHNVILVVYYGQKVEEKFRAIVEREHLHTVYLSGGHLKKIRTFYQLLKTNQIDMIFSYLLTTNLIGAVVGKLAGVKVRVGGIRNAKLDQNKEPVQRFINNHLSTHTIFNNYDGINELGKRGFKTVNATVIPNCFELNTAVIHRADTPVVRLITVGRFVQQKGYFEALKIMQALKRSGEKFRYFMIGFGEQEADLRKEVNRLQLEDVVEIVINPPNMADYYIQSDIYLCTSYFEGLSNTVMEALSFSMPVVASDAGDNRRLVFDGVNGFLVKEVRADLFIDPLKKLIRSSALRNSMGEVSFEIIRDTYSGKAFKKNYSQFIVMVSQ